MHNSPCLCCDGENNENHWCDLCVGFLCDSCSKDHHCYEELIDEDMPAIAGDRDDYEDLFKE